MCGIAAALVAEGTPAVAALYEALLALQHRGQDAAGIVTEDAGQLCLHKDNGMVRDVFTQQNIERLTGDMGTSGKVLAAEAISVAKRRDYAQITPALWCDEAFRRWLTEPPLGGKAPPQLLGVQ